MTTTVGGMMTEVVTGVKDVKATTMSTEVDTARTDCAHESHDIFAADMLQLRAGPEGIVRMRQGELNESPKIELLNQTVILSCGILKLSLDGDETIITLECGESTIQLAPSGITIKAPKVTYGPP